MSEEQRASQIGSGLTSRFRNQLSSYNNYQEGRARTMEGSADAYRQNLISMYGKSDSGKLMNKILQGQSAAEIATSATGLGGIAGKGIQTALGRRLTTLKGRTAQARAEVDRQFPEQEDVDTSAGTEEATSEVSANPVLNQGASGAETSAVPEDFSGSSSGIEGVGSDGSIQVSSTYTQGADPATAPSNVSEVSAPSEESVPASNLGEAGSTTELSNFSNLPVEGLGGTAPEGLAPPPPSLYTTPQQTGLSEEGYYASRESQLPQRVMFDNTQDPPLSDIMDRMQRGDLTLGDSPEEAQSAEQSGGRLNQLLDTSADQSDTTNFSYGGAAEQDAIAQGAPSINVGAGTRAITQTELSQPKPTVNQPVEPEAPEPPSTESPFNPTGGALEGQTQSVAEQSASKTEAVENPNSTALTDTASKNVEQVSADLGKTTEATADIGAGAEEGFSAGQTAAMGGLEGALGAEAGVEAGIGILGAASTALGVLAPLGLIGGAIYEAIEGNKAQEQAQKKQQQAVAEEQSEINTEDNESQFTQGRPNFGSMSLAPNLDMTQ